MQTFTTDKAPIPLGHYSQAVSDGQTLCVSTQLPIKPGLDPDTSMSAGEQVAQVLHNILAILESAGLGPDKLLRVTLYVTDLGAWPEVNAAYAKVLGSIKPTRGVLHVGSLNHGFTVAGDAIASHRNG